MKKAFILFLSFVLTVVMIIPASAASWAGVDLVNEFDNAPAWYDDAEIIDLVDYWVDGETNARAGDNYVYLKEDGKGDFSIQFDVPETGVYNIGVTLMGWTKSVLRSTNIKVDDADWVYLAYDYNEEDQYVDHFFSGMLIELGKGTHTFTLSLASDFDDSNVKSLYFYNMFYALTNIVNDPSAPTVVVPTETPEDVPTETPTETPAETVPETAPESAAQTFDLIFIATVAAAVSLAGCAVAKKK